MVVAEVDPVGDEPPDGLSTLTQITLSTPTVRAASSRALGLAERQAVLDVLHSERFADQSPAEVQANFRIGSAPSSTPGTMPSWADDLHIWPGTTAALL